MSVFWTRAIIDFFHNNKKVFRRCENTLNSGHMSFNAILIQQQSVLMLEYKYE